MAIVTWNLHGNAGDLRAMAADLQAGRLTGGRPREVVLLLQEASADTTLPGLQAFFAPVREVDGVERGNAILSSLPMTNRRAIQLPRGRQRRVAAVATLSIGGSNLVFVSVHLENRASWWRGGLPGDRIRARQMKALLAQIPDGPGVLGGDLNVWLGTGEEAYRLAVARFPDPAGHEPVTTFRERLALDHLMFRLPPRWRAARGRTPERYGSDHFPVVGILVSS